MHICTYVGMLSIVYVGDVLIIILHGGMSVFFCCMCP